MLDDAVRSMGIAIIAGRGSGKSVFAGGYIAAQDCLRGVPQVILEGLGPTTDNLLATLLHLEEPARSEALSRVRLIDMSGKSGSLTAWPLITHHANQSLYEATQPYSEVVWRTDPALQQAPVEGMNAFLEMWINAGTVMAARKWQISEAPLLLNPTPAVVQQLLALAQENSEAAGAVSFLLETLPALKTAERARLTSAFRRKIAPFQHDPTLYAMTGATAPAIDWQQVVDERLTVCLDFRQVHDSERKRFLMLWVLRSLLAFLRRRGAGRHAPIALIIDEFAALYQMDDQAGQAIFAADLDEIINVLSRNFNLWITLALQSTYQLNERAQKTLLSMGTKIFGVISDPDAALTIARVLHNFDPTLIKLFEPVFDGRGQLIDARPVYWSNEEQELLVARALRRLKPFHFLVVRASREGDSAGRVFPLYVPAQERGVFPKEEVLAPLRQELARQCGLPRETLLAEIAARQETLSLTTRSASREERSHVRLEADAHTETPIQEQPLDIRATFGERPRKPKTT